MSHTLETQALPDSLRLAFICTDVKFGITHLDENNSIRKEYVPAIERAIEFLKQAQSGRQIVETRKFQENAVRDVAAVDNAFTAYLRAKPTKHDWSEFLNYLAGLVKNLETLKDSGPSGIAEPDLSEMQQFFTCLREVARREDREPIERVTIG